MCITKNIVQKIATVIAAMTVSAYSFSAGMQPSTSVVLVNEEHGEYGMNVKNTDKTAALLYTSLQNIEEDPEKLLIVTPPVSRVEGGETQLVRFILQSKEPLKTQRLMRVYFEGIPLSSNKAPNSVGVTVRQNLPVIISPRHLAAENAPWKHLKFSLCGGKLQVINDSPYVVRLAQIGTIQPSSAIVNFPKPYLLPNTKLDLEIESTANATSVRIHPASVYGFALDRYDAQLSVCTR